ncbi:MAG: hypothetical protein WCJ09_11040 [Planctomycetota bacterium]
MFKRIGSALLALAMAVVLVPAVADAAGGSGGGGSVKTLEIRVTGYITAIDHSTGVITVGASYYGSGTLLVTSSSKISLDNVGCTFDDIVLGDWAEVRYDYYTKTVNKLSAISF